MEEMKQQAQQAPPPPTPPQQQAPEQPKPQPTQPVPTNPQSQAPEAPHPQAVPAKPNFAMGPQNPADQLRQDMQNAMHGQGQQSYGNPGAGGLSRHPGAGTGGWRFFPTRRASISAPGLLAGTTLRNAPGIR